MATKTTSNWKANETQTKFMGALADGMKSLKQSENNQESYSQ